MKRSESMTCCRCAGGMALRSRIAVRSFCRRSGGSSLSCENSCRAWCFLRRGQVFPGFHALQDAVLLLRRQAAETPQAFPQNLLPQRRKAAEQGIVFEGFLLLVGRQVFVAAQPLSGVIALQPGLPRFLPGLAPFSKAGLGRTASGGRQHQRGHRSCHRDGLQCADTVSDSPDSEPRHLRSKICYRKVRKTGRDAKETSTDSRSHPACTARSSSTSKSEYRF